MTAESRTKSRRGLLGAARNGHAPVTYAEAQRLAGQALASYSSASPCGMHTPYVVIAQELGRPVDQEEDGA